MKRLFAFVLVLMLALGTCAFAEEPAAEPAEAAPADAASLAGEWYVIYLMAYGSREIMSQSLMDVTLNEDGTAVCKAVGYDGSSVEAACLWSLEDNVVSTWEEGTDPQYGFKFTVDGTYLRFTPDEEETEMYYLLRRDYGPEVMENHPTQSAGIAVEDFNGTWGVCAALDDDGVNYSEAAFEALYMSNYPYSFEPTFENGTLTYFIEANMTVQKISVDVAVVDDAIVIENPGKEGGTVTMRLHTDGYMSMAYETPERYYVLFYEKR